jgi:hypothetical protein
MQTGNLKAKARPILPVFVLACSVVTVGLLFIMQKSEATREALASRGDYSVYLAD